MCVLYVCACVRVCVCLCVCVRVYVCVWRPTGVRNARVVLRVRVTGVHIRVGYLHVMCARSHSGRAMVGRWLGKGTDILQQTMSPLSFG